MAQMSKEHAAEKEEQRTRSLVPRKSWRQRKKLWISTRPDFKNWNIWRRIARDDRKRDQRQRMAWAENGVGRVQTRARLYWPLVLIVPTPWARFTRSQTRDTQCDENLQLKKWKILERATTTSHGTSLSPPSGVDTLLVRPSNTVSSPKRIDILLIGSVGWWKYEIVFMKHLRVAVRTITHLFSNWLVIGVDACYQTPRKNTRALKKTSYLLQKESSKNLSKRSFDQMMTAHIHQREKWSEVAGVMLHLFSRECHGMTVYAEIGGNTLCPIEYIRPPDLVLLGSWCMFHSIPIVEVVPHIFDVFVPNPSLSMPSAFLPIWEMH